MALHNDIFAVRYDEKEMKGLNVDTNFSSSFDPQRRYEWHNFWDDVESILPTTNITWLDTSKVEEARWEQTEEQENVKKPFSDLSNIQSKALLTVADQKQSETRLDNSKTEKEERLKKQSSIQSIQEEALSTFSKKPAAADEMHSLRTEEVTPVEKKEPEMALDDRSDRSWAIFVRKKKRCNHCGSTETPQWRPGPTGRSTLCNACGMRYKSGKLLPEYRPRSSPAFDGRKHSNFHKRIMRMRRFSTPE
ncbi:GATA transcription factor 3-like [Abrus precatorius]|uniref:GATA transcription factor 3-like n=1 Tax=Abrus precatorius TaxID=3816 RepID=A0A8B8JUZ1_ABRPR|nr:GATA transcription factor 3-like [Abrus precatorius]